MRPAELALAEARPIRRRTFLVPLTTLLNDTLAQRPVTRSETGAGFDGTRFTHLGKTNCLEITMCYGRIGRYFSEVGNLEH